MESELQAAMEKLARSCRNSMSSRTQTTTNPTELHNMKVYLTEATTRVSSYISGSGKRRKS
jgi:hypothetical protein